MTEFTGHATFNTTLLGHVLTPFAVLFVLLLVGVLLEITFSKRHRRSRERALLVAGVGAVLFGAAAGVSYYQGAQQHEILVGSTHTGTQRITTSEQALSAWVKDRYNLVYVGTRGKTILADQLVAGGKPVRRECSLTLNDTKKTSGGWFTYQVTSKALMVCDNDPGAPGGRAVLMKPTHP